MELIVFGSLFFWFALAIIACVMVWGIEEESNGATGLALVVGLSLLWFFTGFHALDLSWIAHNWGFVVAGVIGYILMGVLWGGAKWFFFLHNKADEYEAKRVDLQKEYADYTASADKQAAAYKLKNPDYVDSRQWESYKDWLQYYRKFPPLPSDNKGNIILWMVWWPWSGFWTLLNDPLRRLYRVIYQNLVGVYTRMSYAVFGGRFTELK